MELLLSKSNIDKFSRKPYLHKTHITDENGEKLEAKVYIKRLGLSERDLNRKAIADLFGGFDEENKPNKLAYQSEVNVLQFCQGVVDQDNTLLFMEDCKPSIDIVNTFDTEFVKDVVEKYLELNFPEFSNIDKNDTKSEAEKNS